MVCVLSSQTDQGKEQAFEAGKQIRELLESTGQPYKIFCIHSPYRRTIETSDKLRKAFKEDEILGVQEEVQLREQGMARNTIRSCGRMLR